MNSTLLGENNKTTTLQSVSPNTGTSKTKYEDLQREESDVTHNPEEKNQNYKLS